MFTHEPEIRSGLFEDVSDTCLTWTSFMICVSRFCEDTIQFTTVLYNFHKIIYPLLLFVLLTTTKKNENTVKKMSEKRQRRKKVKRALREKEKCS